MATIPSINEQRPTPPASGSAGLLVSLGPLSHEALAVTLANLAEAFPAQPVLVATPDHVSPDTPVAPHLEVVPYTPPAPTTSSWLLSAADYLNTWKLIDEHHAGACLLLGPEPQSLGPSAVRALAQAVVTQHADLATPRYDLSPRDGLVNSAILFPVTRALFATRSRYPLAVDLALSTRMAERLATVAQRHTASGANAALVWPVPEAAVAGYSTVEVAAGSRALPPPGTIDLNSVLAQVAGSFFAEVDAKAAFWQRARLSYPPRNGSSTQAQPLAHANGPEDTPDVAAMLDSFRLAYANLHEIWALVLPPNSLLGLKKLSQLTTESLRMPDPLWARIVYDFILAYRLRVLNRGHLLGALTPLYLAWVASHLLQTSAGAPDFITPEKHIEAVATAFEADKPYLVSRWRWPDRFNP